MAAPPEHSLTPTRPGLWLILLSVILLTGMGVWATPSVISALIQPPEIATDGAKGEAYESMLLSVGAVTITNINPDDPNDYDEFSVTGDLRIDDGVSDAAVPGGLGNDCPLGTAFDGITGILGWSFSNTKLQPRDAADVLDTTCSPFN